MQTYSSKSTAARGAKRAGITNPGFSQNAEGKWSYIDLDGPKDENEPIVLASPPAPDLPAPAVVPPVVVPSPPLASSSTGAVVPKRPGGTSDSYSDLDRRAPAKSEIANPVSFIHAFLERCPTLPRKQAITILVDSGCNLNTAKSQFQIFHAKRRGKSA